MQADKVVGDGHVRLSVRRATRSRARWVRRRDLDELLGLTQSLSGQHGMTGRLTVHYRSPTPLHTELRLEGTLDRSVGRKTLCTGRLYTGEVLCAEAEGLFITVDFGRLQAMIAAHEASHGR